MPEDLPCDRPRGVAEDVMLDRVESARPPTEHTRMGLLEAARGRAAIPEHREVRERDFGRELLEDELEVASSPEREDARGNEVRPSVRLVQVPPLELLPDPGDDAGGLVGEDVHDRLLPHPCQDTVTGTRM
eukprot:3284305-Alexandrium_andersonii.AAC.1